jgi:hypothetical protein
MKKIFYVMLAAVMLPLMASAQQGTCGEGLNWKITADGYLYISGADVEMTEFGDGNAPWKAYANDIVEVNMSGGISIAAYAFKGLPNLRLVVCNQTSLRKVGDYAFANCAKLDTIAVFSMNIPSINRNAFDGMPLKEGKQAGDAGSLKAKLYIPYELFYQGVTMPSYMMSNWNPLQLRPSHALPVHRGTSGEFKDIVWTLDKDGVLDIYTSATVPEAAFELEQAHESPFYCNEEITEVIVHKGVYDIGVGAFYGCTNLRKAVLEEVYAIGFSTLDDVTLYFPFDYCPNLELIEMQYSEICDYNNSGMYVAGLNPDLAIAVPQSVIPDMKEDDFWGRFKIYALPGKATGNIDGYFIWTLSYDGTLSIVGSGNMPDYTSFNETPWANYMSEVNKVVLSQGITRVGAYSFCGFEYLEEAFLAADVYSIGDYAFGPRTGSTRFISAAAIAPPVLDTENAIAEQIGSYQQVPVYVWNFMEQAFKKDPKWSVHDIRPLSATMESLEVSAVTAEVKDENTLYVTWPSMVGATLYTVTLYGEGIQYRITVNDAGIVLDVESAALAPSREPMKAVKTQDGFGIEIMGLKPGTYQVEVVAKDDQDKPVGTPMQTVANTKENELPTAIEDVQSDDVQGTKVIRDGQVVILNDGQMYNVQGIMME